MDSALPIGGTRQKKDRYDLPGKQFSGTNVTREKREMNQKNIEDILLRMGIPASVIGFRYIVDAILFLNREGTEDVKYTYLYYLIAKKNQSTIERVERAIRHALSIARKKEANHDLVEHYIGFIHKSNSSSLKLFYLRLKEEEEEKKDQNDNLRILGEPGKNSETMPRRVIDRRVPQDVAERLIEQITQQSVEEITADDEVFHLYILHDRAVFREQLRRLVKELIFEIVNQQI